jgi:hypothetical protein
VVVTHTNIPYQFDVTNTTNVVNIIVEKIIELAKDNSLPLPDEVRPFARVDLAEIADAMRKVADWQTLVVNRLGLSPRLIPRVYEQCDYGSIISYAGYYGDKMNAIIDATQTQEPPEFYEERVI